MQKYWVLLFDTQMCSQARTHTGTPTKLWQLQEHLLREGIRASRDEQRFMVHAGVPLCVLKILAGEGGVCVE